MGGSFSSSRYVLLNFAASCPQENKDNRWWNDKIVALEKTTWFHFRLMKTGFLFFFFFFFFADHLLVGQLWTNPKSDWSLLSCLKVTQCSTSEIGDAPLYSTLKRQIWIATNNRDVPRVMKIKFPAKVMVFGVVSSEGHIMPPHIFDSAWKSTPKCTWMCWRVWWSPGAIRWSVADPGCGSRTRRRPTSPKRPRLGFTRSATILYPFLTGPSTPPTWTCWTTPFGHTSRTSPTWPPTTP